MKENDEALTCDLCNFWYHCKCEEVNSEFYQLIVQKKACQSSWYCKRCFGGAKQLNDKINVLHMTQKILVKDVDDLKEKQQVTDDRLSKVEKRQDEADKIHDSGDVTMKVIKELKERKKREKNLMMYKLSESEAAEPEERKNHDIAEFTAFCKDKLEMKSIPEIEQILRLGPKNESGPRPMKVRLKTKEEVDNIMTLWYKVPIKDKKVIKTPLSLDRTPSQVTEEKKLRETRDALQRELEQDEEQTKIFKYVIMGDKVRKIRRKETTEN